MGKVESRKKGRNTRKLAMCFLVLNVVRYIFTDFILHCMQLSEQVLEKLEMHMAKICSEYTRGLDRHRQACLTSYILSSWYIIT